jgi:uncharacterized glyoxalase superfamily protein PhnB
MDSTFRAFSAAFARRDGAGPKKESAARSATSLRSEILKPAQEAFWGGYSGYFSDPDGRPWDVAHNPHSKLANGRAVLPK